LGREAGEEVLGGTLPRANALLRELAAGARSLRRLAEEIESEPQSLVFGRRSPAPGPGESGFEASRQ
ncbi:MAG TPA: MCE family protein, partial [Rhodocyclaceae bacterium]|nr:MCE family protein [Rhodocyclaceae bacterium]